MARRAMLYEVTYVVGHRIPRVHAHATCDYLLRLPTPKPEAWEGAVGPNRPKANKLTNKEGWGGANAY